MDKKRNRTDDLNKLADAFFENLMIGNCEYGGIGLDDKRPFGNSYVEGDILEIIGMRDNEEGEDYANELYGDLIKHLQAQWARWKDVRDA